MDVERIIAEIERLERIFAVVRRYGNELVPWTRTLLYG
jgi:hypothetical protein